MLSLVWLTYVLCNNSLVKTRFEELVRRAEVFSDKTLKASFLEEGCHFIMDKGAGSQLEKGMKAGSLLIYHPSRIPSLSGFHDGIHAF
jgi:hypothetical protein